MDKLVDMAVELQALAQAGLEYGKDKYDIERFTRIREISAEILALKSDLSLEKIKDLFCCEEGYATPKLDTRAAIFKDDKIMLVREIDSSGTSEWSLPGGWADVDQSVRSNIIKEAREEAGAEVEPIRLIAVQDRKKHNQPPFAYGIWKVFVLCDLKSQDFRENIETSEYGFFALENLPPLSTTRNTVEQIKMCFDAYHDENWKVLFD